VVPILTFDLETVPDVQALRQLRPQWATLGDREVALQAFAERRERTGNEFLAVASAPRGGDRLRISG